LKNRMVRAACSNLLQSFSSFGQFDGQHLRNFGCFLLLPERWPPTAKPSPILETPPVRVDLQATPGFASALPFATRLEPPWRTFLRWLQEPFVIPETPPARAGFLPTLGFPSALSFATSFGPLLPDFVRQISESSAIRDDLPDIEGWRLALHYLLVALLRTIHKLVLTEINQQ
ncbi:MAG: hypothetical protein ACLQVY_09975, partial [Limisphaerales bacterium]